jgi:hypothetical protein
MSEVSPDERTDARIQEAADNAERVLSETNDTFAPSVRRKFADAIVDVTREAPLHSLTIAFLLGALIARQR